jgi:hypothetical protein
MRRGPDAKRAGLRNRQKSPEGEIPSGYPTILNDVEASSGRALRGTP